MTWNLDPPPGFQGLHPERPVTIYERHLPHWRQPGATYFVTFRLADSLRHFDGERYELGCFVVMPNHVHLIVRPIQEDDQALERILHSWKRYTAREINKGLGHHGALWQNESYDRIIRDEEHLWRTIQYIGRNASQAGLTSQECPRWISPTWAAAHWTFTD